MDSQTPKTVPAPVGRPLFGDTMTIRLCRAMSPIGFGPSAMGTRAEPYNRHRPQIRVDQIFIVFAMLRWAVTMGTISLANVLSWGASPVAA